MSKEEIERRITMLESNLFYLRMKDHWSGMDYDRADEIRNEISNLKKMIKGKE